MNAAPSPMNRIDRLLADYRPRDPKEGPAEMITANAPLRTVEQALAEIAADRAKRSRRS